MEIRNENEFSDFCLLSLLHTCKMVVSVLISTSPKIPALEYWILFQWKNYYRSTSVVIITAVVAVV